MSPYAIYETKYLNTLSPGDSCRQSMGGLDLIVLAVPAGPSKRLQTLVKVYDTLTRRNRNIIGTSMVYVPRSQEQV